MSEKQCETTSPITLLIVDDHPVVRDGLSGMFATDPGFVVLGEAANGDEAVRLARVMRPDVILMDLLLPNLSGSEIAARLATDAALRTIPLIFMTAAVTEEAAVRAGIIGPHRFLTKPIQLHELLLNIEAACTETAYDRPSQAA